MSEVIRMFFGIPPSDNSKKIQFEIKPKMINPDVVRMDLKSFRQSLVVQNQAKAALSTFNNK